jgi:hypothetical protein
MRKFNPIRTQVSAVEKFCVTLPTATLARLKRSISLAKSSSEWQIEELEVVKTLAPHWPMATCS